MDQIDRKTYPPRFYWFAAIFFLIMAVIPAYWAIRGQAEGAITGYTRYGPHPVYEREAEPEAFRRAVRFWAGVSAGLGVFGIAFVGKALHTAAGQRKKSSVSTNVEQTRERRL